MVAYTKVMNAVLMVVTMMKMNNSATPLCQLYSNAPFKESMFKEKAVSVCVIMVTSMDDR